MLYDLLIFFFFLFILFLSLCRDLLGAVGMGWIGGRAFEVSLFNSHSRLPIEGVSSSSQMLIAGVVALYVSSYHILSSTRVWVSNKCVGWWS